MIPDYTGLLCKEATDVATKGEALRGDLTSGRNWAVNFMPVFIVPFHLSGKMNEQVHRLKDCLQ
jgi:hypothetical protein